ncbi:MAG: anti-sigma factor family protein [Myxococcales bacterium]
MSCADAAPLVELEIDGELDARATLELEQHLSSCAACARRRGELLALRAAVREGVPRFELPPRLPARIFSAVRPRRRWPVALAAASMAAALAVGVFATSRPSFDDEVTNAHVRSLLADHLTDVVSSDQHTVKPWFQGKLDFGVPVRDFADRGFPLAGGRLDYLHAQPVAAVVYRHGAHAINLFVWPEAGEDPPRSARHRGYNQVRWKQDGLSFWLVSDVAPADLEALARLIRG